MDASTPSLDEMGQLAEEAYVAAYPMLENYKTMDRMLRGGRRGLNVLYHNHRLLDARFSQIVAPNNDTLYSNAWLDLSAGPLVLRIAGVPDHRYYSFQLVNLYNFNFGYMGSRTTGWDGGSYLIRGPDWQGEVPANVDRVFRSETRFAFLLGRTLVDGPDDLENVRSIQAGFALESLAAFLGSDPSSPPTAEVDWAPYDALRARSVEFIAYFNWILANAEIHPDDAERIGRYAAIGIAAGRPFDASLLTSKARNAIEHGIERANEAIDREIRSMRRKVNGWSSLVDAHGPREVMASRPLANAAGAREGLYGNDKEEARNFATYLDDGGRPLHGGEHAYVLRFEPGGLPPVHAFWSMTLYRLPELLFAENPLDRYSIGDRTAGLRLDPDGGLVVYVQRDAPGPDRESNWLPAPDGPFALALRSYLPDLSRFEAFRPPAVQRVRGVEPGT